MKNRRRVLAGATVVATVGLVATGITAAAQSAVAQPTAQTATAFHDSESAHERANKRVVEQFYADVLNGHHGDHATRYLAPDMAWHGGTVGTVAGAANVAGLMTAVVTSMPDLHATPQSIVAHGDEVIVRVVVTGTQKGPLLGIPASGRAVRWDATDWYHMKSGKIGEEWAAEDFTAFLNDTGTYKVPWIP